MEAQIERLTRATAFAGGGVLLALIFITCISIIGRALTPLSLGPVPGDFELIENGIAFCVFCCLPWCLWRRGHATVDLLEAQMPKRLNMALVALWDMLSAIVFILIVWRLSLGALSKFENGETTFLLQFPIWWGYAASVIPACVSVAVAVWKASRSLSNFSSNRSEDMQPTEFGH
jgi:TRAP-type C4-dicarboxylate transport system permease small subunit